MAAQAALSFSGDGLAIACLINSSHLHKLALPSSLLASRRLLHTLYILLAPQVLSVRQSIQRGLHRTGLFPFPQKVGPLQRGKYRLVVCAEGIINSN